MGSSKPLTIAEYATIWLMLFQGTAVGPGGPGTPGDAHATTASAPTVLSSDATAVVTPLGKPELPAYTYEHQNTDRASKWRIVVTGTLPSATTIVTFKFGSMFTRSGKPFQPAVQVSDGRMKVASILPDKFSLDSLVQFQNETADIAITVTGGD